jgi:hypothetical protein
MLVTHLLDPTAATRAQTLALGDSMETYARVSVTADDAIVEYTELVQSVLAAIWAPVPDAQRLADLETLRSATEQRVRATAAQATQAQAQILADVTRLLTAARVEAERPQ